MILRRVLAVTVSATLVLGLGVIAKASELDAERADVYARAVEAVERADAAEARGAHLAALITAASEEKSALTAVLAERPGFVDALAALATALGQAEGRIDTETHRAAALAAQSAVLEERDDPAVIVSATATIRGLTAKVDGEVEAWSLSHTGPGVLWASSGSEGYARVRAALDRVGGAGIGLYESGSCAGGSAPACANSDGYIKYRADVADWDEGALNWAMAHELAHIHQFRVWGALTASGSYQRLFGSDPEFLANCMAVVRGCPGSVGCDAQQQAWASGVWVGVVR
ncbi:hypothetical protein ACWGJP_02705 [Microbacterium sp. NPDC055903]